MNINYDNCFIGSSTYFSINEFSSCGIVDCQVGKSTIFSALTMPADSGNFPFTTIEPNVAVNVKIID